MNEEGERVRGRWEMRGREWVGEGSGGEGEEEVGEGEKWKEGKRGNFAF